MALLTPKSRNRARQLRKDDTEAERRLWEAIRNRRVNGAKFVRQLPIGLYFADFVCREQRLIVEVDGATHGTDDEVRRDERRTTYLHEQGYRIIRFWNDDIYRALPDVLDAIVLALEKR